MAQFVTGAPIETDTPQITVDVAPGAALPTGRHQFQLVVGDDSGNQSQPDLVEVIVLDQEAPTAILDAPRTVPFGQSFELSAARSADVGGRIVRYIWTRLS
ncbi:MAG: hypothetical protein ACRDKT_12780 [Actinomycetota bacterium]